MLNGRFTLAPGTLEQMQTELLPFTALGTGLEEQNWAGSFMQARAELGFNTGGPFLTPIRSLGERGPNTA